MKKILVVILCLLLLTGCGKQEEKQKEEANQEPFVLAKVDESKDYVYLTDYKKVKLVSEDYNLQMLIVNVKGSAIDNVNLELKSFVQKSYDEYQIYEGLLIQGKIINYEYYITDDYISIIQKYYMSVDTMHGDEDYNSYVISLKNGKVVDNDYLLKEFKYSEDDVMNKLEKNIKDEDSDYIISRIKKDGFDLFVDKDNKLNVLYRVINDDESVIKKLVLN